MFKLKSFFLIKRKGEMLWNNPLVQCYGSRWHHLVSGSSKCTKAPHQHDAAESSLTSKLLFPIPNRLSRDHSSLKSQPILANLSVGLFFTHCFWSSYHLLPYKSVPNSWLPSNPNAEILDKQTAADFKHLWWLIEFISLPSLDAILSS